LEVIDMAVRRSVLIAIGILTLVAILFWALHEGPRQESIPAQPQSIDAETKSDVQPLATAEKELEPKIPIQVQPFVEPKATQEAPPTPAIEKWTIEGTVRFSDGSIVADAPLSFGSLNKARDTKSDEEGRYRVEIRPEPVTYLRAKINGFGVSIDTNLPEVPEPDSEGIRRTTWDVTIPRLSNVFGKVLDEANVPVEGAQIFLCKPGTQGRLKLSKPAKTDSVGAFSLNLPITGLQELALGAHESLWPLEPPRQVLLSPNLPADAGVFRLARPGKLRVRFLDAITGNPMVAFAAIFSCPPKDHPIKAPPTDAYGWTEVEFGPGDRSVRPFIQQYTADPSVVEMYIPPGGTPPGVVEFRVSQPAAKATCSLRVLNATDAAIESALVKWGNQTVRTNFEGIAILDSAPEQLEALSIEHPDYYELKRPVVALSMSEALTMRLKARGRLVIALRHQSGKAPIDARCTFFKEPTASEANYVGETHTAMLVDGRFSTQLVPADEGHFLAIFAGGEHGYARARINSGQGAVSEIEVVLEPVRTIQGTVWRHDGKPAAFTRLYSGSDSLPLQIPGRSSAKLSGRGVAASTADDQGNYSIVAPLRNGVLVCLAPDGSAAIRRYSNAASPLTLHLQAPSVLRLKRGANFEDASEFVAAMTGGRIAYELRGRFKSGATELEMGPMLFGSYLISGGSTKRTIVVDQPIVEVELNP
jgi:hypothetical protein